MESFPIKLCKNIRSHWSRSKYQRLDNSKKSLKTIKLRGGGGNGNGNRRWRIRRTLKLKYLKVLSPIRLLARLRDAYMDAMIGFARKNTSLLTGSTSAEVFSTRTAPKTLKVCNNQQEFERRLMMEIYKSLAASRGITDH